MDFRYNHGRMVQIRGVTHVVQRNHGIRIAIMCKDGWQNISQVQHGQYEYPTCLNCVIHHMSWMRLYNEWAWRTRDWMNSASA